ncbi:MAG TPA: ATP-binding protein [Steroidobacteraceae bacterium]|nr:ATP-binding protein [Steroidobacteraceae bacterium]
MTENTNLNTQPAGPLRFKRLRLRIVILGVLVVIAFAGSSAYDAWRSYNSTFAATHREITNVATALAEQTAWTFQGIDLLLHDTARWYQNDSKKMAPERLDEVLANRSAGVRQIRMITITDAQGIQRHRSRGSSPPYLDVSDRSYFIAQRDGTVAGLFMSEPVITRSDGRPGIILSRRLEDETGAFAGVVAAIVDLEDLAQFYAAVTLGNGSAVQLLRDDGQLLMRDPPDSAALDKRFPQLAALKAPASRLVNPIDGKRDFVAVARVRDTPLVLAVTREEMIALRPWRDEAMRLAARSAVVALLGLIGIGLIWRQLRRIEAGEGALRASEERYALAMEGANEGHWDWDLATDRLFLSAKMAMLEGHGTEHVTTTRAAWLAQIEIHPDDRIRLEPAIRDHLEGRTPSFECEYRVRNGDWRWLLERGRCLRDETGRPYRFVGSAIDVTAQKQAQLDRERLEAQLRQSQKMEAMGTLAGGIAHDFNNILGAILGYGELVQQLSTPDTPLRRYIDNVMHAAGRAKALVDGILGFSRSGLGERAHVHVQSVIEETLELIAASLPAAIRLEKNLIAGDAALIGDSTHLHQVAMNLCTNAVHAMEHGGILKVLLERVDLAEAQAVSRGTLSAGPYVRLVIADTGVGIPPAVVERIFDPFFTTRGVGKGTGLGLSLVHGIVTDLGGAIDVKSAIGEGTCFQIWLPVSTEAGRPATTTAVRELPLGRGETVMIVDDEPMLVALAEEMLAGLGYEPVGFESSRVALQAFRAKPARFDLILTDEAMPELVGTELAREIRRLRPDVPIILMSGHGGAPLEHRAAAIDVKEVLHKPLQRVDLAESLARALDQSNGSI